MKSTFWMTAQEAEDELKRRQIPDYGQHLWNDHIAKGRALKAFVERFPRSLMGMVPDHVKAMAEYKRLKSEYDAAFIALRNYNASKGKK